MIAKESRPLLRLVIEPFVHGESGEHEQEKTEAQHQSPSCPAEPDDAHLMNARGILDPEADGIEVGRGARHLTLRYTSPGRRQRQNWKSRLLPVRSEAQVIGRSEIQHEYIRFLHQRAHLHEARYDGMAARLY